MTNKAARTFAKQLRDVAGKIVGESFAGRALPAPNW